ncbi:MAG TPA: ElyC/SanA/YdcF family protein, partial [Flavobacteriales bacterium]|nr:ElyC/SanA/YdcF family protein [Flavobacteriales bacterium]
MEGYQQKKRTHPLVRFFVVVIVLGMLALVFREPLMRSMGAFLIRTDTDRHVDVLYVLGGAPFDRGNEASVVLAHGFAPIAYCTGSSIQQSDRALGIMLTEADLTRASAINAGADPRKILPYPYGTSTREEAAGVLRHAQHLGADTIMVLSTDFHTRRVGKVFRERFAGSGITVLVHAAPSSEYDPDHWWNTEQGLLMVNNEYVKTVYYAVKY